MGEFEPTRTPEIDKRRSSRIAQTLPLIVMGVDALGRSFQEETSTSVVNCQGCRYASKHYVLKNMWVTLGHPSSDLESEPRVVRARVAWIQRPRTLRDLFQVGVETETRGNIWGISPAPPDWFSCAEAQNRVTEIPSPPVQEAFTMEDGELKWTIASAPDRDEDNLRTMPLIVSPETTLSLSLAGQMALPIDEARQQLQAMVRECAAEAVSAEAGALVLALQFQIRGAAEQAVAAATAEEVTRRVTDSQLAAWRERWENLLAESLEQAGRSLSARLGEIQRERLAQMEAEIEARKQQILADLQQAALERVRDSAGEIERGLEESCRLAAERWLSAISKASETTQNTFESLFRTADLCENRFQSQMQGLVEKSLEEASVTLRDKAAKITGMFVGEMGVYSRTYIEYTQGELEAAAKTAQAKLNTICNQVFSAVGETLRRRLLDLTTANPTAGPTPAQTENLPAE